MHSEFSEKFQNSSFSVYFLSDVFLRNKYTDHIDLISKVGIIIASPTSF